MGERAEIGESAQTGLECWRERGAGVWRMVDDRRAEEARRRGLGEAPVDPESDIGED